MKLTRRQLLKTTGASAALSYTAPFSVADATEDTFQLHAQPQSLYWFANKATDVWGYSHNRLEFQQHIPVSVKLVNQLSEPTTVHWHGVRVPNAMDGVSGLTQPPVQAGESFTYQFTPKDAGTFWAHAHHDTYRQLALGLYTPIIVKEAQPYQVDQDLLFVADDWLLNRKEQIDKDSFEDTHAWSHGGRMGNFLTINKEKTPTFEVTAGERVRLRLMNTANSRVMEFTFPDVEVTLIAKDGQPLKTPIPHNESILIAPAERYDVIIDIPLTSKKQIDIIESSGKKPFLAARWNITRTTSNSEYGAVPALPANPLPNQDFAVQHNIKLDMQGGAMGNLQAALYKGEKLTVRELVKNKQTWTFNGIANMPEQPLVTVKPGDGVEIELRNETRWPHAMHMHGHHFLAQNEVTGSTIWQDTTLVMPGQSKIIRFVAETEGKWLLHCHMLEHQVAGMITYFEVTG
ncbi:multicopper oxidase family protein [Reinekea forsetii]|nr:multicopper oxidase family protein [Reinekea forsetii]